MTRAAALALTLVALAAPARAWWFGPKFTAWWRERAIAVDGDGRDWPAERRDDAADMTFSFANDEDYMYVLFSPHTRTAKQQLAGSYDQSLTLWVDPDAGMARTLGVSMTPPQKTGLERYVRVITAAGRDAAASARIEAKTGAFDERGVLEARVPLALLGSPAPKRVSVGLETSKPSRTPLPVVDPKGRAPDEAFAAVRIWVRVTLARPPKR